jgi:hypothetical protein
MTRKDITGGVSGVGFSKLTPPNSPIADVYDALGKKATTAISWYQNARGWKKRSATLIRWIAVLAIGAAAAVVGLQATALSLLAHIPIGPGSVELGLAGIGSGVLVLDKVFGYSTGWVRYMITEMNLQKALDEFRMDWVIAYAAAPKDANGEVKDITPLLQLLKTFSGKIDSLVSDETQQWVIEFQDSMAWLQKAAKEVQAANNYGAVAITITRGAGVDASISVEVDGQKRATTAAATLVLSNIPVGTRQIKIAGTKAGAAIENYGAATVTPNALASVTIPLT